jgi:peptidoglycan/xylan/chitin deacetylase (PgdA/CDA1 family)
MTFKLALAQLAKYSGTFQAASRANKGLLTILAYHAFSVVDGYQFRPRLFMRPEDFASRLDFLRKEGFRVLPLDEAIGLLQNGSLRRKDVAITIDDGFHTAAKIAIPLLRRYGYPATIYVTTYYVQRNHPIFRIVLQYCFWRSVGQSLRLEGLVPGLENEVIVGSPEAEQALWTIIGYGESCGSEDIRVHIAREIGRRLEVSYDELVRSRRFTLMSGEEIAEAAAGGIDIQLHTHRHRLPSDQGLLAREIAENRSVLEPLVGRRLRHLCYPSNIWSRSQWPELAAAGIETATTCDPGMNHPGVELLGLRRFLDGSNFHQILFEAELFGVGDTWRALSRMSRKEKAGLPPVNSLPDSAPRAASRSSSI